ncbi:MAG: NAD(P)-dependent alcohol dehydrogenase [Chloroflexi bacterium]|nr:NAD(P)-dependent alcohol dehydrogenase [Chloroflexota bacterium]
MKAILWTKYGPPNVLQLGDVEKPTPKDNEVLIKIIATTVTAGDCEMRSLDFPIFLSLPMRLWIGFKKPKENTIPGTELAGVIDAIGKDVKNFKIGDPVFGAAGMAFGTNAEYICMPEERNEFGSVIAIKPKNMSYEEAATVPFGGRDALHFLRLANLQGGEKMLINGAGGSIGVFAVQLAKYFGAEVTAVDSSEKLEILREIGADHVIDYTQEDFTKGAQVYDIIFDIIGKISFSKSNKVLKKDGTYLLANPISQIISAQWVKLTSKRKVIMQTASGTAEDLVFLRELVEAEKLKTVIDRSYPLEEIVKTHEYVETGRKKGNLVIKVEHNNEF